MYFWGLVSPKSQAPNFVLERKICVKRSDSQSPMMYAMLWVSTAVPLKDWKSKMYSEVTSYLQRTSRGLPQGFFFFNPDQTEGPVNRNKRAHRSSQHCGKKESFSLWLEIQVTLVFVACSHQVFCFSHSYHRDQQQTESSAGEWQNVLMWPYLYSFTMGHQNYQRVQEELLPLSLGASATCTLSCTQTHTHIVAYIQAHT